MNKDEIYKHFDERFEKELWVPKSWLPHIWECHLKLVEIDPHYTIHQIKEKFWELRYYFTASRPELEQQLRGVVTQYEKNSQHWEWSDDEYGPHKHAETHHQND